MVLLGRRPEVIFSPQFFGEEGPVYFQGAYNEGWLATFFRPESGFFHLPLHLTATLSLLTPLAHAPAFFRVVSLCLQMLPVLYLISSRAAALVPNPLVRMLLALTYVVLPNSQFVHLSVTTAQWHLSTAALLLVICAGPRARWQRIADGMVLALFALSTPIALFFVPAAFLLLRLRRRESQELPLAPEVPWILLAGSLVEVGYLLSGSRLDRAAVPADITALEAVRILSTHGFLNSTLGIATMRELGREVPFAVHLLGVGVLGLLLVGAVRLRHPLPLALGLLAAGNIAAKAIVYAEIRPWLDPSYGVFYYFPAALFVCWTSLLLVARPGWLRYPAALVLVAIAAVGVPGDYRILQERDTSYPDQIAAFGERQPGERFRIPTRPYPWSMTLVRKPGGSFPRFPRQEAPAPPSLKAAIMFLGASDEGDGLALECWGYAVDTASQEPAAGVVLRIDGRIYPAVLGFGLPESVRQFGIDPSVRGGFGRVIPLEEIGPGPHEVELLVISDDRTRLFTTGVRRRLA